MTFSSLDPRRPILAALAALAVVACDPPRVDPECRCMGAVPGGALDLACGASVCLDGANGYRCTGMNTAVADPAPCAAPTDAGPPSPGVDAGPPPPMVDAGPPPPPVDAGPVSCTTTLRYRDGDGDGYGDPAMSEMVCPDASGYADDATDCDDASSGVHPGAAEACDGVDTDCDEVADPASCAGFEGAHAGGYEIVAEERLGSSVINRVRCASGSSTVTIDLDAEDVVSGTATCTYSGSLGGFASTQTATLTGTLNPDGTVEGRMIHDFGEHRDGSFAFEGTIVEGALVLSGTGRYRPSSMSAVDWIVDWSFAP